jgi:hypothetical protein
MSKMRRCQAVGFAAALLCVSSVGCFMSAPLASSSTTTPLARSGAQSTGRSVTRTGASERAIGRDVSGRPAPPSTTSVTVMGGGSPSSWPAARKVAPSLAGAYSPNLKTAFLALVRYSDWLGSHPNPNLVKHYVLPTSNLYRSQVYLMQQMVKRGWHISPQPTEIDFLKVVVPAVTRRLPNGRRYLGGVIETVIDELKSPYLDRFGKVVGRTAGGGPTAYVVSLVQDSLHTQFYIDVWQQVTAPGDGLRWEHKVTAKQ